MTRRRLPIDWGELEMALTWHTEEGGHYLDLTTGEVVSFTGLDEELAEGEIAAGLAEGRLIPIEPLPSSVRRLLEVALDGRGAFRRFKDVLADYAADRERWFAFRGERVREAAREWLEENRIEAEKQGRRS